MAQFLNGHDTISGTEGRAQATIDGRVVELFNATSIEASIEFQKGEVKRFCKHFFGV